MNYAVPAGGKNSKMQKDLFLLKIPLDNFV